MDVFWFWFPILFWGAFAYFIVVGQIRRERERERLVEEIKSRDPLIVWITQGEAGGVYVNTSLSHDQTVAVLEGALDAARKNDMIAPAQPEGES